MRGGGACACSFGCLSFSGLKPLINSSIADEVGHSSLGGFLCHAFLCGAMLPGNLCPPR